jgi:hypothetical protein
LNSFTYALYIPVTGEIEEIFEALLEICTAEPKRARAASFCSFSMMRDGTGGRPKVIRWHTPCLCAALHSRATAAETLWALVDEPIITEHIATIEERDAKTAQRCVALAEGARTNPIAHQFHWWPKPFNPN